MNRYSAITFFCLFCPILGAVEQVFNGTCPMVKTIPNFNESQYAGKWYEIKRYANSLIAGECGAPSYKKSSYGFNVSYLSRNIAENKNVITLIELKQQKIGGDLSGKYDAYSEGRKQDIPQYILDTDYKTYSIVWGCSANSTNKTNIQRMSVYSRKVTLNSENLDKVNAVLKNLTLDVTKLKNVEQNAKKCGRGGGSTTTVSYIIISTIFVLALTRLD